MATLMWITNLLSVVIQALAYENHDRCADTASDPAFKLGNQEQETDNWKTYSAETGATRLGMNYGLYCRLPRGYWRQSAFEFVEPRKPDFLRPAIGTDYSILLHSER